VTFGKRTKIFQAVNGASNSGVADVFVDERFLSEPDDLTVARKFREGIIGYGLNYHEFD